MRIAHRTLIRADPARVWAVTAEVERWPDWTPTMRSVRGLDGPLLAPGRRFSLRQPLQPEAVWQVTAFEPGRAFAWATGERRRLEASHRIEPAPGGCRSVVELRARGAALALAWPLLGPILRLAVAAEARALRRKCEARPA